MNILIDLFCGRGGWTKAAQRQGWKTIGYDIVDLGYPGTLIKAPLPISPAEIMSHSPTLICASPPCDEYARYHLPWIRKKTPPDETLLRWSISLAALLPVPVIIECSRFAAMHVPGSMRCGSYRLWGSVPALLPDLRGRKMRISGTNPAKRAEIDQVLADWIIAACTKTLFR